MVKRTVPTVAAKSEAPPPLDLKSLEQRPKETNAIGVLTKLSLKNQVDDLLEQVRECSQGRLKTTLAEAAAAVRASVHEGPIAPAGRRPGARQGDLRVARGDLACPAARWSATR